MCTCGTAGAIGALFAPLTPPNTNDSANDSGRNNSSSNNNNNNNNNNNSSTNNSNSSSNSSNSSSNSGAAVVVPGLGEIYFDVVLVDESSQVANQSTTIYHHPLIFPSHITPPILSHCSHLILP